MAQRKIAKAPCRGCLRETKQAIVATRVTSGSEEDEGYYFGWKDTYEMLQCLGCDTVTLRHTYTSTEDDDATVSFYPPPISRPSPTWRHKLPLQLRGLLEEIYTALHANSRRLALMGARTALDMVMFEQIGDTGTFAHKLASLETQGVVSKRSREVLEAALNAGHAASHRGFQPRKEELGHVMDILENLLQAVYVLEHSADELRKRTPARHKGSPKP